MDHINYLKENQVLYNNACDFNYWEA